MAAVAVYRRDRKFSDKTAPEEDDGDAALALGTVGNDGDNLSLPAFFGVPRHLDYNANMAAESYFEAPMTKTTAVIWSIMIAAHACILAAVFNHRFLTWTELAEHSGVNLLAWWLCMYKITGPGGPKGYHFVLWMLGSQLAYQFLRMVL